MALSSACNFKLALNSMREEKCTLSPSKQALEILLSWRRSRPATSARRQFASVVRGQEEGKHILAPLANNFRVPLLNTCPLSLIGFPRQAQSFTFQKNSLSAAWCQKELVVKFWNQRSFPPLFRSVSSSFFNSLQHTIYLRNTPVLVLTFYTPPSLLFSTSVS